VVACAFVVTALAYGIGWAWLTPELERYRLAVRTESIAYASMLDEETGLRAYLMTDDPEFMEPYPRAEIGRNLSLWPLFRRANVTALTSAVCRKTPRGVSTGMRSPAERH
jgi:hypothetical protein